MNDDDAVRIDHRSDHFEEHDYAHENPGLAPWAKHPTIHEKITMNPSLIIGTRGSALALWQANAVAAMLRARHADLEIALEIIETKGDRVLDASLEAIGDKGLFTKELEVALLERRIDCAVHSLKDMQTELPEGLSLGAVP